MLKIFTIPIILALWLDAHRKTTIHEAFLILALANALLAIYLNDKK